MRILLPSLLLLAACGSAGNATRETTPEVRAGDRVRVVYNQYRGAHTVFVIENLAGRDVVELRSRALQPGEVAVSYVPDDVIAKMLEEFDRFDYYEFARPRPPNPQSLGASGEITVTDKRGRRVSLLRIRTPAGVEPSRDQVAAAQSYGQCARTFLAVWNAYPPRLQATTSRGAFGVNRDADRDG